MEWTTYFINSEVTSCGIEKCMNEAWDLAMYRNIEEWEAMQSYSVGDGVGIFVKKRCSWEIDMNI